jgi:hypothetical protein
MKLPLLAFISLIQVGLVAAGNSLYLYQHNADPIKEYTDTEHDFTKSTNPRLVEFYSPHCVSKEYQRTMCGGNWNEA